MEFQECIMATTNETKQITIEFVNSDELKSHHFGIVFDEKVNKSAPNISKSNCGRKLEIEIANQSVTKVELIAEPFPKLRGQEIVVFARTKFSFEVGLTYYLRIVTRLSGLEISITEENPTQETKNRA